MSESDLLPLEIYLRELAENRNQFPDRTVNYFQRYWSIKEEFKRTWYRNTESGLAAADGILYTHHDAQHVNDVIERAGRLLGLSASQKQPESVRVYDKLNPFEIYATLVGTVVHDAGNAEGRDSHERRANKYLSSLGEPIIGTNRLETRYLAAIAKAHGGKTAANKKDTISDITEECYVASNDVTLRGRLVAGLVRFADELAEGPTRANSAALLKPYKYPASVVHHLYCKVIQVNIDLLGKQVHQRYHVPVEYLTEKFEHDGRQVYLIEFIAERLLKCDRERRYCQRYFREVLAIDCVRATVTFEHDGEDINESLAAELREQGYPDEMPDIKKSLPRFDGERLAALGSKFLAPK